MAKSEDELKSLLMKKERRLEKLVSNSIFKNLRPWHPVPSLHGK